MTSVTVKTRDGSFVLSVGDKVMVFGTRSAKVVSFHKGGKRRR